MDQAFRFAPDCEDTENLAHDPRLALLSQSIATQQAAGFGDYLDLRQFNCPDCGAPGFNSGLGAVVFTCKAEWLGDEQSEPCTAEGL